MTKHADVERLRVLHVTPSVARRDGGPSEAIRHLMQTLTEAGVDVALATTDKNADAEDLAFLAWIDASIAKFRPFPPSFNYATGLLRPLWRQIQNADLVHVHSVNTYVSTVAVMLCRIAKKPVVLQPHGALTTYQRSKAPLPRRLYAATIDRALLSTPRVVIVSSAIEARQLPEVARSVVRTVALGVEPRLLSITHCSASPPFILFLGRVTQKKRLELVLQALRQSTNSALRLKVAGPIAADLTWSPTTVTASLGLEHRVEFLGKVEPAERERLLATASAFVLPSDDESFGIAAAEAMAAGCLTIVSEMVGVASDIADITPKPVLVVHQTSQSIAEAFDALDSRAHEVEATAAAGRRYARSHFDWTTVAETLVAVYRHAVGEG